MCTALIIFGDTTHANTLVQQKISWEKKGSFDQPLLLECIIAGNFTGIQFLSNHGVLLSSKDLRRAYNELVSGAITEGSNQIAEMLFSLGANPNWPDSLGYSVLSNIVGNGHNSLAALFLKHGANPNAANLGDDCALVQAVRNDDAVMVQMLLDAGALVDALPTPLPTKVRNNNYSESIEPVPNKQATALMYAIDKGSYSLCKQLLLAGAQVTMCNKSELSNPSVLDYAFNQSNDSIAQLILSYAKKLPSDMIKSLLSPSLLINACTYGYHPAIVESLIVLGINVNTRDNDGNTPLSKLLDRSFNSTEESLLDTTQEVKVRLALLDLLINKGADITIQNEEGATPLLQAVQNGFYAATARLLDAGADINVRKNNGNTPLILAAMHHDPKLIMLLLSHKPDVSISNNDGGTALHEAVNENNLTVVQMLVKAGADINAQNDDGETPLYQAISSNDTALIKYFIKQKADISINTNEGWTALLNAIDKGNLSLVKLLINAGADMNAPNKEGRRPIAAAVYASNTELINYLLQKRVNITYIPDNGQTLLHDAVSANNTLMLSRCLAAGIKVDALNEDGETPLSLAIQSNAYDCICPLIAKGANPFKMNSNRSSPLHALAALKKNMPCFSDILYHTKQLDIQDEDGITPLMLAAQKHTDHFKILLDKGASLAQQDHSGLTALMHAASTGQPDNVARAIERKPNLNDQDHDGETALFKAVCAGDYTSVILLLKAGALPMLPNESGETPLNKALQNCKRNEVLALLTYSASIDTTSDFLAKLRNTSADEYSNEIFDSLIALVKSPKESLPVLPPYTFESLKGFWFFEGTVPREKLKGNICRTLTNESYTITTSPEFFEFTYYQMVIHAKKEYEFIPDASAQCSESKIFLDYKVWSYTRSDDQLILVSQDSDECRVYRFAGTTMPPVWQ